jgi:hypothetical protein
MSRHSLRHLRLVAATLLATVATAAIGIGTALAGGGGGPFPR